MDHAESPIPFALGNIPLDARAEDLWQGWIPEHIKFMPAGISRGTARSWSPTHRFNALDVSLWFAIAVAAVFPLVPLPAMVRQWDRRRRRRCLNCGYDLRASIQRCPECGTAIALPRGGVMAAS
jgi:hypothetical protein